MRFIEPCPCDDIGVRTPTVIDEPGSTILKCSKKTLDRLPTTCLNMGILVTNIPRLIGVDVRGSSNRRSICMVSDELSALLGI